MLNEHGFGDHGTRAARPGESGDCGQQMQNKDGQIAHGTILARSRHPRNAREFRNSPWTACQLVAGEREFCQGGAATQLRGNRATQAVERKDDGVREPQSPDKA